MRTAKVQFLAVVGMIAMALVVVHHAEVVRFISREAGLLRDNKEAVVVGLAVLIVVRLVTRRIADFLVFVGMGLVVLFIANRADPIRFDTAYEFLTRSKEAAILPIVIFLAVVVLILTVAPHIGRWSRSSKHDPRPARKPPSRTW